jgi:pSer/pThr/pTyr-binding forkhead associated (FHA) protein
MAEVGSDHDSHSQPPLKKRPLPPQVVVVGGAVDIPCYCLLDGIDDGDAADVQDEEPDRRPRRRRRRLTVPITRLPAKFGRRHETTDPHFYSLGSAKAVSREHARLDYRFPPNGAYLKSNDDGVGFRLLQRPSSEDHQDDNDNDDESNNNHHKDSGMDQLPATGAYVLTCLSKNKIMVNQERIDQDSVTVLQSGAAIKIGPVCVYFLLPTTTTEAGPHQSSSASSSPTSPPPETETTPSAPTPSPLPKQPHRWSLDVSSALPVAAKSLMEKEESRGSTSSAIAAATTTTSTGTTSNVHLQLEALSWNDLADEYRQAKTDRRKQIVQSVIVARGALEAAVALQQERSNDDDDDDEADTTTTTEYAANDIIAWLEHSAKYGPFQNEMKDRMEPKSYKASITKALLRAGFCRNNALGPRVRWHLPASVVATAAAQKPPPQGQTTATEEEEGGGGGAADSDSPEEEEEENDNDNGSAAVAAEGEQEKDDAPDDDDNDNDDDSMEE